MIVGSFAGVTSVVGLEFTGLLEPPLSSAVAVTVEPGVSGLPPGVGTVQLPLLSTVVVAVLPSGNLTVTVVFGSALGTLPVTVVSSLSIGLIVGLFAGVVSISAPVPAMPPAAPPLTPPILSAPVALFKSPKERKFSLIFE